MRLAELSPAGGSIHSPDFESGIPWEQGIDLTSALLPLDKKSPFMADLSGNEQYAFSWALGLLAASAIKEHERVLNDLRHICDPEPTLESSAFFLEEATHSAAYGKFLELSAKELKLSPSELGSFLPTFPRSSFIARLYAVECFLGGSALWWTVAATEEESIRLYQKILPARNEIDPVFFELNRLHFLEESRHSSFSYKMIAQEKTGFKKTLNRYSFLFSRIFQTLWLLGALKRFRKVKTFSDRHSLLGAMATLITKIDRLSFREKIKLLLKDISYIRMMTEPEKHPRLKKALEKENAYVVSLPEVM
jgi:hypothetical protein